MHHTKLIASAALIALFSGSTSLAANEQDMDALRAEIQALKQGYEGRIATLESKLEQMGNAPAAKPSTPATDRRSVRNNSFNPSIGVVLNGRHSKFSADESEFEGVAVGHEGERHAEGFSSNHTEMNFSSNVDDKFYASVTAALVEHDGENEVETEEAYFQTLPGAGLPDGMTIKAGRAFWTLGYMNEHHMHADDFADRPLPYRVFLNGKYNDDGVEVSYVLPTDLYAEIGTGYFRGDAFPFGGADGPSNSAWSAYGRLGGDIGDNQSWRIGVSQLSGQSDAGRVSNDDDIFYVGDVDIFITDIRYTWAPTGNPREQELTLQAEFFEKEEDGTYEIFNGNPTLVDDSSDSWYAQAVYKFAPQWRVGLRYSELDVTHAEVASADPANREAGYDPEAVAVMLDWTNSEFSRLRLQYNEEKLAAGQEDEQVILQYVMSIGAHGAHKY